MTRDGQRIETQLIHAGEPRPLICGAVSLPMVATDPDVGLKIQPNVYKLYLTPKTGPRAKIE